MYRHSSRFLSVLITASLLLSGCGSSQNSDIAAQQTSETASALQSSSVSSSSGDKAASPDDMDAGNSSSAYEESAKAAFTYTSPTAPGRSNVYIEPVTGIADDFIRGVDASEVLSIENSGAEYYDASGKEQDVFTTLAQKGVNYIRLRVWNDPYDDNGNGYGGGNCDLDTALTLGKRASENGMRVMIDFHYSDFWADPERQLAPKSWEGLSPDDKAAALYTYTYDSLKELFDNGVDVGMVQVGNETNNGMAGETDAENVAILQQQGSKAVRDISEEYGQNIKVCLHYTNPADYDKIMATCSLLKDCAVDYDVLALSFYSYWHGDFDDFAKTAEAVQKEYGKDVLLAEFSYPYTSEDGDFYTNSAAGGQMVEGYTSSVQSQASFIRDTCKLASDSGCLGVFYWGGTWIPAIGKSLAENMALWQKYGCGWAACYASDYDPANVGSNYGGCAWDNQALFDFSGKALVSLDAFNYLSVGTICDPAIDFIPDCEIECTVGNPILLPESVDAVYNDRSLNKKAAVKWDEEEIAKIDSSESGEYVIDGICTDESGNEYPVKCTVDIGYDNLALNPGFEDDDLSMWNVEYEGSDNPTDYQDNAMDAFSGTMAFHYWSEDSMDFTISQTVEGLDAGTYMVTVSSQGGDTDDSCEMTLYAVSDGQEYSSEFMNTSWADWQHPEIKDIPVTEGKITFGVHIKGCPKSWGTLDDFILCRTE